MPANLVAAAGEGIMAPTAAQFANSLLGLVYVAIFLPSLLLRAHFVSLKKKKYLHAYFPLVVI
jgi:hypothetical protein